MLGHVVYEYFKELGVTTYGTVSHAPNPTDIMYDAFKDMESIEKTIDEIKPDVVFNCSCKYGLRF